MLNLLLTCSMYYTTILDSLSCLEGLRRCVVGQCILKTYSTSYTVAAERVRVTVRVRPPTRAEQKEEDGAPFIFLDTDKNTVILRRKYVLSPVCTDIQFDTLQCCVLHT